MNPAQSDVQYVAGSRGRVFVFAHPSTAYRDHFLHEALVARGEGVLNVDGRYVGRAFDLRYAQAAEDIAVAIRNHTKGSRVILCGHSGGGSLMTLAHVQFGVGDQLALLAAHPSRAHILRDWIDPSWSGADRDTSLDLANQSPPFDPAFLAHYRSAQSARIERIAARAAALMAEGKPEAAVSFAHCCADPRFVDDTIDPNERRGFALGDPFEQNAREDFMGGQASARGFLDQWYLPTTPADGIRLAPHIRVPVLHLRFGADGLIFPSQSARWNDVLPAGATIEVLAGAPHNPRHSPPHVQQLADRLVRFAEAR